MTDTAVASARRQPVQERSAARVERMLDAAAGLLDEVGHDGTTTSTIARRARVSVGSLYQFFPDRRAVLQALALRAFTRFSDSLDASLGAHPPKDWRAAIAVVVEEYVAFTRSEPGMRVLSFGGPVDSRLLTVDQDNNAIVAARLEQVLAGVIVGLQPSEGLSLVVRVAVESADAVLSLAFQQDDNGDPAIVAQATALLTAYFAASGFLPSQA
jgi:AcrR family transcriptional regulator